LRAHGISVYEADDNNEDSDIEDNATSARPVEDGRVRGDVIDKSTILVALVNKEFVNAHLEMQFHHHGHRRYAYGPKRQDKIEIRKHDFNDFLAL
jgi:hypothetical protein